MDDTLPLNRINSRKEEHQDIGNKMQEPGRHHPLCFEHALPEQIT
jgi:hypothetical protein